MRRLSILVLSLSIGWTSCSSEGGTGPSLSALDASDGLLDTSADSKPEGSGGALPDSGTGGGGGVAQDASFDGAAGGTVYDATVCPTCQVYYVSNTGNDDNSGTSPETAWATIQKAADTLKPGDLVNVLAGNYLDRKVILKTPGTAQAPITFQAQGLVTTVGFLVDADYITIRGFDVSDTQDHRINGDPGHAYEGGTGIFVRASHCTIEDNYVHFCVWGGISLFNETDPTLPSDCVVQNNRLFKNGMQGIDLHGRNNLVEGNEIWGTIQHHPNNAEHTTEGWLDADGLRFFGAGHAIRRNYIHDISFGPPGLDASIEDYNDDPHIDCFQTWTDSGHEPAQDILFERNWCDNAQGQSANETGQGFMIEGQASALTVRNNVVRAYRGMNVIEASEMHILNNTFVNDLSLSTAYHPNGVGLSKASKAILRNNLFFDMAVHTITLTDGAELTAETGKNLSFRSDGKPLATNDDYYDAARRAADLWDVNPLLAAPHASKPDYHLTLGSPAIDVGYALTSEVSDDYDGTPRPQGIGYDIGAFEFLPK